MDCVKNIYAFNKNHHALEIKVHCKTCPSREEVRNAVLARYPHTPPNTIPSQDRIQWRFNEWHRYGSFDFSMPFPYGSLQNPLENVVRIQRLRFDCKVCGMPADFAVDTRTEHGTRSDKYCVCHMPEGVATKWAKSLNKE